MQTDIKLCSSVCFVVMLSTVWRTRSQNWLKCTLNEEECEITHLVLDNDTSNCFKSTCTTCEDIDVILWTAVRKKLAYCAPGMLTTDGNGVLAHKQWGKQC
jgi:hypothetical protein